MTNEKRYLNDTYNGETGLYCIIDTDIKSLCPSVNVNFTTVAVLAYLLKQSGHNVTDLSPNGFSLYVETADEAKALLEHICAIVEDVYFNKNITKDVAEIIRETEMEINETLSRLCFLVEDKMLGTYEEKPYAWHDISDEYEICRGVAANEEECYAQAEKQGIAKENVVIKNRPIIRED